MIGRPAVPPGMLPLDSTVELKLSLPWWQKQGNHSTESISEAITEAPSSSSSRSNSIGHSSDVGLEDLLMRLMVDDAGRKSESEQEFNFSTLRAPENTAAPMKERTRRSTPSPVQVGCQHSFSV